ncbi:DUF916 domain-containing protein [bacterium]|nr:MAG: DUF916 domain-containing protein [bacterium]
MKRLISTFMAAFAVLTVTASIVPAQQVGAQSSASLSIVPKKTYTVEPGKSVKDKLTIRNMDKEIPLELNLRVIDFTFTDDGGTPKLMLNEDAPQTKWSLKPYLTVPKTVKIEPGKSKTVDMSVAIPANRGAGSLYSAIVYSSGASDGGNVGLSASGVTLVFASIPGTVSQDLTVEKFGAYNLAVGDRKASYTSLTTTQPKNIAYTLKNKGNVTEAPTGTITLKGTFGKEITIANINPNESLALIDQTRTFVSCIKLKAQDVDFNGTKTESKQCAEPGLWPGYYKATLNLVYGQNGNATKEATSIAGFWYLPWWFVIIVLVLFGAIAIAITLLVRKFRGKNHTTKRKKLLRRK